MRIAVIGRFFGVVLGAALVLAMGAGPALAADYYYWYALQDSKVPLNAAVPGTALRASQSDASVPPLSLSAAQAEYEGRQIVIKAITPISGFRIDPSDLVPANGSLADAIPAREVAVDWVYYVHVSRPSYGVPRTSPYQPDALPPTRLENGRVVAQSLSSGVVRPFYVLLHVPDGTPAGIYQGTLRMTADGAPAVVVPVVLRVYGFSVAQRTLKTSFGLDLRWARYTSTRYHLWPSAIQYPERETTRFGGDTISRWMQFMDAHRLSPRTLSPAWGRMEGPRSKDGPLGNGVMPVRQQYLRDFLGTGRASTFVGDRLNFDTAAMPDGQYQPGYVDNPFSSASSRAKAANYYRSMRAALSPWIDKTIVYAVDEPDPSQRSFVEQYGAFVHKYAPGAKFAVTLHGKAFGWRRFHNVDIYVQRLHFWWYDYSRWVAPIRRSGRQVWIYSHTTDHQGSAPLYLVDKPLTESRIQGWFAYLTGANGILYYNTDRWQGPTKYSRNFRDPYVDTLSSIVIGDNGKQIRSNGDGCLVYPGYYPRLGLDVVGAAPVSSLRMEALRDGLEDYEYLNLLAQKLGRARALAFVARLINTHSFHDNFPRYSKSEFDMQAVRDAIAAEIEAH